MSAAPHSLKLEWFDLEKCAQQKLKQAKNNQGALFCFSTALAWTRNIQPIQTRSPKLN